MLPPNMSSFVATGEAKTGSDGNQHKPIVSMGGSGGKIFIIILFFPLLSEDWV